MYVTNATTNRNDGTTWELRGTQVICDDLTICELEYVDGFWMIAGDEYKFANALAAFYFVMDRCV